MWWDSGLEKAHFGVQHSVTSVLELSGNVGWARGSSWVEQSPLSQMMALVQIVSPWLAMVPTGGTSRFAPEEQEAPAASPRTTGGDFKGGGDTLELRKWELRAASI